jgi:hypothetical protein
LFGDAESDEEEDGGGKRGWERVGGKREGRQKKKRDIINEEDSFIEECRGETFIGDTGKERWKVNMRRDHKERFFVLKRKALV